MQTVLRAELETELINGPVNLAQPLINAVIGNLKYRDWTCPVTRLTGSYASHNPSTAYKMLIILRVLYA